MSLVSVNCQNWQQHSSSVQYCRWNLDKTYYIFFVKKRKLCRFYCRFLSYHNYEYFMLPILPYLEVLSCLFFIKLDYWPKRWIVLSIKSSSKFLNFCVVFKNKYVYCLDFSARNRYWVYCFLAGNLNWIRSCHIALCAIWKVNATEMALNFSHSFARRCNNILCTFWNKNRY